MLSLLILFQTKKLHLTSIRCMVYLQNDIRFGEEKENTVFKQKDFERLTI